MILSNYKYRRTYGKGTFTATYFVIFDILLLYNLDFSHDTTGTSCYA